MIAPFDAIFILFGTVFLLFVFFLTQQNEYKIDIDRKLRRFLALPIASRAQALATPLAQKAGIDELRCVITKESTVGCLCNQKKSRAVILIDQWALDHFSDAELENVIAHEIIHIAKGDINSFLFGKINTCNSGHLKSPFNLNY